MKGLRVQTIGDLFVWYAHELWIYRRALRATHEVNVSDGPQPKDLSFWLEWCLTYLCFQWLPLLSMNCPYHLLCLYLPILVFTLMEAWHLKLTSLVQNVIILTVIVKSKRERERWQVIEKDNYVTFFDFTNSINLLLSNCVYTWKFQYDSWGFCLSIQPINAISCITC